MTIRLPLERSAAPISLDAALKQRESKRDYLDTSLSLDDLSHLLLAAQGKRDSSGKRHAPSAQEQYPLTNTVVAAKVDGIPTGVYQYNNTGHTMVPLKTGQFVDALERTAIGEQPWIGRAAAVIVLSAYVRSMNAHFADQPPLNARGERNCYIEIGAVSQNVQLVATGLDIGMVLVGGFHNDRVKTLLELPENREPAALFCLGNV
ncbi:MAG: SagB/ThcOx family dehydrogenase [Pseudomonadota bacterium]